MSEKLTAPQNIVAEPRDNAVRVSWDEVEGADGYTLFFFRKDNPRACIKKRYAQRNTKQVLGFFNGDEYQVYVRAFRYEDGKEAEGEASKKISFIPISMHLKAQKVLCLTTGEIGQIEWEYRNKRPYALFYCEDETIAEVDRNGIVKALAPGHTEVAICAEGEEIVTKIYVDRSQTMAQAKAVLMFTGDIMCAVNHQRAAANRQFEFYDSFDRVRNILTEADLAAGVLETTCYGPAPYEYEQLRLDSGAPNCNSPSEFLTAVAGAGFDMLVTANNHCCDTGYEGLNATVESVKQLGMYNLGTMGDNPIIRDINGIRVAFMAFTMITNNQERDIPEITPDVMGKYSRDYFERMYDLARGGGAEYVIAYQHWGGMNSKTIKEKQELESKYMAMCGVDLIVGSHPHVIQPFRYITTPRGRVVPCAYSLGNFISSQAEMKENRDSVILRVELHRDNDEIKADISYIPCLSANSQCGVKVFPINNYFNDSSQASLLRVKNSMGNEIAPYERRPSVMLSGSVIIDKIFSYGDDFVTDRKPLLLSQLAACGGEDILSDDTGSNLGLETDKSFHEYIKENKTEYIAVDFYTAAAVSCYERNGTVYTGTNRFLKSKFYNKHKNEFTRIKPPYKEEFWKPLVRKYADAILSAYSSERIILFRHRFSDKFVKGRSELRNIPLKASLNKQISAMEEYFISLTDPLVIDLSKHYFNVGSSPSEFEQEYFIDAYNAVNKIVKQNRRCIDTPDIELWFDRVMNYYDNMTARAYQSWLLDMNNAADIIMAYTNKEFCLRHKNRLIKLKECETATLKKAIHFFWDDPGAFGDFSSAAEEINLILSGDISKPYSFYSTSFRGHFNILKKMAKLLSEKTGVYVSAESAERVFILLNKPEQLEQYQYQLKNRTADIWGSCVTREIFNNCKNSGVGKYIFKQSPVLAYDRPVPVEVPEDLSQFCGNQWRRRTINEAFARSGIDSLKAEHSKWLAVDFYDVICTMNEYMGELFEVDDFICRTGFYKSIKSDCTKCSLTEMRTEQQCADAVYRFAADMSDIYGSNIVLIKADLKDTFITLDNHLDKLQEDEFFEKKRRLIALCEDIFIKQTGCAVIDISKHFYASDKFPLGGAHIVHYEHEFYREAGVYLSHILGNGRQRIFVKADENYIAMRDLRLER